MNRLLSFFKKLRLGQVLTIFIAGVALFLTTACNSPVNEQGARPNNLPVQVGGNNNPQKGGGDGYTDYQMSTDPSVKSSSRASQNDRAGLINFEQLIAARTDNNGKGPQPDGPNGILYPGPDAKADRPGIGQVDPKVFQRDVEEIPAQRQPVIDRSDPDVGILEKVGEAFKEGSSFLQGDVQKGSEEAVQNAERKGETQR